MPLELPAGLIPGPIPFVPTVTISPLVTEYRFDLLSNDEAVLGTLNGVEGGSIDWQANASVKGGGSLDVTDVGDGVDWLNVRIRPVAILGGGAGMTGVDERPIGVFIPAAPVENWNIGRRWKVELLDKCSILDQDIVTDEDGNPVTFSVATGANVVDEVIALIIGGGETAPAISPADKATSGPMVWEVGTSRLRIINDLLAAANFFSLWVDNAGQFRVTEYDPPSERVPVYEANTPFSSGDDSLMNPAWDRDRDIYSVPNRYVVIGVGDGEFEAPVAVATNEDINSPFSFQSRGRWITQVVTGVEATTQADLESRARMGLSQATSVTSAITVTHAFLPDMRVNSVVRFKNPDADLDILCSVSSTSLPLNPTELCKTELREVVA